MLAGYLGNEGFRRGMDLYFKRHDGAAVTCDDFIKALADANDVDLSAFEGWYKQAGTPHLSATRVTINEAKGFGIAFGQTIPENMAKTHDCLYRYRFVWVLLGTMGRQYRFACRLMDRLLRNMLC